MGESKLASKRDQTKTSPRAIKLKEKSLRAREMRERKFESKRNEREQAEEIRESKFESKRDGRDKFEERNKY